MGKSESSFHDGASSHTRHRGRVLKLVPQTIPRSSPLLVGNTRDTPRIVVANLIFDALPFGRRWHTKPGDAIGYAEHRSRSRDAVIRVYDDSSAVIETHEHAGDFKEQGIAPIQLPARKPTLSETIRQRPMRAGCWRFLHANDDKVTACGFRNDVRSR
jgi:hypothetical protein